VQLIAGMEKIALIREVSTGTVMEMQIVVPLMGTIMETII
jgi:hypothetical protein